jgi:hypothetical protein
MRLFEQLYRTNRIYWHGSNKDFENFDQANESTFLSTSKEFAIKFAKKNRGGKWLYMCRLTKPVNLFNIASDYDREKMVDYLKSQGSEINLEKLFNEMKSGDRLIRSWNVMERLDIIEGYKALGYDGFTATEYDDEERYTENIALFDVSSIKILKQFNYLD